ncbi:hypothetical protein BGX24_005221 [Mortierella sp. AD032]|nr:hypothetical protein BGX24_005221 [Mortierella sp. AD032]
MKLPRPIPAETALRMVRKIVQTLMYIRGQMGSTWEQLEFLLNQEKMRQEFEEQEQDQSFHGHDPHLGTFNHDSLDQDDENDFVIPTKSLKEFLETSERMFVDLEESIYDQLYLDMRQTTTTTSPPQRPRYISLALVFGTTFTTPKEQYMIRLGPLEPRPLSTTSTQQAHVASSIPTPEHQREEKKWERVLIQELMGIHTITTDGTELQQGCESLSAAAPLRHRTRVHLLMKAPAGRIFTGIFPQQQVLLHEDYPTPSASITSQDSQEEERSVTQSCWSKGSKGFRGSKKQARWPIHHLHLFGPSAVVLDQDSYHANNNGDVVGDNDDDDNDDEMWYLIGPGIPILSPLL